MRVLVGILIVFLCSPLIVFSDVGTKRGGLDSLINSLNGMDEDTVKSRVLFEIGGEYRHVNLAKAIYFTEQSRELSFQLGYRKGVSACLNSLGIFYSDSGLYETAIELTKQALTIDEELEDWDGMVACLINIANLYGDMKDYSTALQYNSKAIKVDEARNNGIGIASSLFNRSKFYEEMTDFASALECLNRALPLYKQEGDNQGISETLSNIGIMHEHNGAYDLAIKNYLEGLIIAEKELQKIEKSGNIIAIDKAHFVLVKLLISLGAVYTYQGEYDKALEYMQRSYRLNNKFKDKAGVAGSLNNIGMVLKYQGKYIEALESYLKSLAINEELQDKKEIASIYNNIAVVYYEQGDNLDMVKEYLEKSLQLKKEVGYTLGIITGLNNLGELYMELGEYNEAITYSKQSLDMAMDARSMGDVMYACEVLAGIWEKKGDYKEAYTYYKRYSSYKDTLFNEDKSKEIGKLEAKFEMDKKLEEDRLLTENQGRIQLAAKTRRDNLQYSGILIFLVLVFTGVFLIGKASVPIRLAEGMIFFAFLLFFEFSLVLLDPFIEQYSGGEPAYKLMFNALLAGLIFPIHSFFENKLVRKLIKKT